MNNRQELIRKLHEIAGDKQVLVSEDDKAFYTKGFRIGQGEALAVALPQTLLQLWQLLESSSTRFTTLSLPHSLILLAEPKQRKGGREKIPSLLPSCLFFILQPTNHLEFYSS